MLTHVPSGCCLAGSVLSYGSLQTIASCSPSALANLDLKLQPYLYQCIAARLAPCRQFKSYRSKTFSISRMGKRTTHLAAGACGLSQHHGYGGSRSARTAKRHGKLLVYTSVVMYSRATLVDAVLTRSALQPAGSTYSCPSKASP